MVNVLQIPTKTIMRSKVQLHIIFILFAVAVSAQQPEYTRRISRSFPAKKSITVDISNKYGRIQVLNWNQDSVKIDIDLRIRTKDKQKLSKLKDGIDFEFIEGQSFIKAETKFGENSTDLFKDLVDIAGTYLSSSNSVTINYTVFIPLNTSLKIENKFGDVYMDECQGNLDLQLSYGDLKADILNGQSVIRLTSGDGDVGYIKKGELFLSYGNIHIREAGNLTAQTRSSNVTLEKVSSISVDSRRDKLFLNEVNTISGECYFTEMNLGIITGSINLSGRYGGIKTEQIKRTFTSINVASVLTDLSLGFEKPLSFRFEMNHPQDIVFVYPETIASINTDLINPDDKIYRTSGSFGTTVKDSKVLLNINRKCAVTILVK